MRSNTAYDWDRSGLSANIFTINGLNQAISSSLVAITYDANGNVSTSISRTYGYDVFNNLTTVTGDGLSAGIDYDHLGRLSEITESGSVNTQFLCSGTQVIAEYDDSGDVTARYVHGPVRKNPGLVLQGR